jgi:hypothetical protein
MSVVVDQIATEPSKRDIAWLHEALQSAIALEHSTLPLYLSAMFSLEVQNYPSYNAIRSVVMEEMVHMAIAANMLAAIGGSPRIKDLDPGYPCHGLPGGAEPDLQAGLAKLSPRQLQNFMRLEAPLFLLPEKHRKEGYPTIGRLYDAIKQAIVANAEDVRSAFTGSRPANQVGDNIGFTTLNPTAGLDPVDQLVQGIDEILAQGEGSTSGSIQAGPEYENEESHYGKFAELWYGARYQPPNPPVTLTRKTEADFFKGTKITWPVVVNTLAVPTDGYARVLARDPNGASVTKDLEAFDAVYTEIMAELDTMWNGSVDTLWPTFGEAVKGMTDLRVLSCFNIMRYHVPPPVIAELPRLYPNEYPFLSTYTDLDKPVFYGPRFRNLAASPSAA